ncbi:uncharacterized protein LOC130642188 [Hydractinia symbiolongicarpus]|uniref:uncharacterized protein LOC130642188 n=1 Tax=Hydractinia symbiolongicarpus TaxID=13093 RepID=UPI00254B69A0|nr:uncharacterized protein LOC130642188 [Hydractinia symbiolongicarpus]
MNVFILHFVLATLYLFASSYSLNKTDESDEYSNVCPFKRIMDHLFIDAEKSLLAVRHLKAKLVDGYSFKKNRGRKSYKLTSVYVQSMKIFQDFDVTERMDFDSNVVSEYLQTFHNITRHQTKSTLPYLVEMKKVIKRLFIHKYQLELRKKQLLKPPCLGREYHVKLWRRFVPKFHACCKNKSDQVLRIVEDVEIIFTIRKSWLFMKGESNY